MTANSSAALNGCLDQITSLSPAESLEPLGERIIDFINDTRETFIALTNIQLYYVKSFKLSGKLVEKKDFIILNKNSIKWIEEAK